MIIGASIETPTVDWLALSPTLALLAAAAVCLLGAVLVPVAGRRAFSVGIVGVGFVVAGVLAAIVFDRSPEQELLIAESMTRDRLAALAQILIAGFGLLAVLISWGDRRRGPRWRVLRAPRCCGRRDGLLRLGREPDDDVPGPRVVLDRALHPRRARHPPQGVARSRAQVSHRRQLRIGVPPLRLRPHVRRHGGARLQRDPGRNRRGRPPLRRRDGDDHRRPRVQGVRRALPHVDTRRVRGSSDPGDRVHVGGNQGSSSRRDTAHPRDRVPGAVRGLVGRDRRPRRRLTDRRQSRGARPDEREAPARVLVGLAGRVHADRDRCEQRPRGEGTPLLPHPLRRSVRRRVRRRRGTGDESSDAR